VEAEWERSGGGVGGRGGSPKAAVSIDTAHACDEYVFPPDSIPWLGLVGERVGEAQIESAHRFQNRSDWQASNLKLASAHLR
jgi:hypothetical protein